MVLDEELRKVRLGGTYQPKLTLNELVARYLDQYDAAPSSRAWLTYFLRFSQAQLGDHLISRIDAHQVGAWRSRLRSDHEKYAATRALRQVLAHAQKAGWIEKNPASAVKNPASRAASFVPFESWAEVGAIAAELDPVGAALVLVAVGTGLRPEELFGLEWSSVDLDARTLTVRRAYAKGRMKDYTKTTGSRRMVPLRERVVVALRTFRSSRFSAAGLVFPSDRGGPINLNNWRRRDWKPAQLAAGITPIRRPYDLRHTYASWSLAAGVNTFQLSRRMGTSVTQISNTYGHLLVDADEMERGLLDAWDTDEGEPR